MCPCQVAMRRKARQGTRTMHVVVVLSWVFLPTVLSRELQRAQRTILDAECDQSVYSALTPTITRAPVIDLQWIDWSDQTVLAVTKKVGSEAGGLWFSADGGKRWTELTGTLNVSLPAGEAVEVVSIFVQKSSPSHVLVLGAFTTYWVSSDYGRTYTAKQTPTKWRGMSIKSFKKHPTKDDWLLLLVKRPDCKALDRAQMECPHDLILTQDMFSGNPTWKNLTQAANGRIAGFVDFDWARSLCPSGSCDSVMKIKDETIFATMYAKAGDYDQAWDPDVNFVVSDNYFSSFSTHVRCGNMFEIIGSSVYLAVANSCPTDMDGKQRTSAPAFPQGITLYTSQDGSSTFTQACMPIAIKQEGYELLETQDGTGAIVIVDFVQNNIPASSVYTAGPHHALFSLSLTNVYHAEYGYATDFSKMEALPGVYMANQMLARSDQADQDYYDLSDSTGNPLVETRLTYNGGGRWRSIPAPAVFRYPQCNLCEGKADCQLHLHGLSSWDSLVVSLPAIYSSASAPGVLMASGNVGIRGVGLDDNDGLCTWLSTDGGVSWRDVAVGAYIYEYADWGGIIVMAKHPGRTDRPAEEVLFSYDGGSCWSSVPLSEALLVDNIRIEPDGQRPRVIIHGRRCRRGLSKLCGYDAEAPRQGVLEGLIYTLDVQELMQGRLSPCKPSDFENWSIPAELGMQQPMCVLGQHLYVQRRKWTSTCLIGPDYKRPPATRTPCACTVEADLECDYGFMRAGTKCVPLPSENMPQCPAISQLHYTVSSTGLRLVHADQCEGVQAILPDTDGAGTSHDSPSSSDGGGSSGSGGGSQTRSSGWFGFFMFMLVIALMTAAFVGWWVYMATEPQRDTVRDLAASVADAAVSVKHWVMDKIRGRRKNMSEPDMGYFQPLSDLHNNEDAHNALFTLK